jgi:hypothetical protein
MLDCSFKLNLSGCYQSPPVLSLRFWSECYLQVSIDLFFVCNPQNLLPHSEALSVIHGGKTAASMAVSFSFIAFLVFESGS